MGCEGFWEQPAGEGHDESPVLWRLGCKRNIQTAATKQKDSKRAGVREKGLSARLEADDM